MQYLAGTGKFRRAEQNQSFINSHTHTTVLKGVFSEGHSTIIDDGGWMVWMGSRAGRKRKRKDTIVIQLRLILKMVIQPNFGLMLREYGMKILLSSRLIVRGEWG